MARNIKKTAQLVYGTTKIQRNNLEGSRGLNAACPEDHNFTERLKAICEPAIKKLILRCKIIIFFKRLFRMLKNLRESTYRFRKNEENRQTRIL